MFTNTNDQSGTVEETIHNVHVSFDPVIHHLGTIRAIHNKNWGLGSLSGQRHLNVGFHAVIQNPRGAPWSDRRP